MVESLCASSCPPAGIKPLMMRKRLAWLALSLAVLGAACGGGGGDEGDSGGESSGETESSAVTEAVSTLKSCLTDAGLEVKVEETTAFGVEAPHGHLEVPLDSESFNKAYAVDLWVFETPAAAEEARVAITLEQEDDERGKVIGSVVLNYEIIPDEDDTKQVEACIEA